MATECEFLQHLALRRRGRSPGRGARDGDEEQAAAIAQLREADTPELPESANLPGGSAEAALRAVRARARLRVDAWFAEALKEESRMPS